MTVGVLAVQGAFAEMEAYWRKGGAASAAHKQGEAASSRLQEVSVFEIRQLRDLERDFDLLALPGGESTVQGKLLKDLGLFAPLKERIDAGLPVFATCAGLILLAEKIEGDETVWFGSLPVTVRRNAYGRQLGSFTTRGVWDGHPDTEMTFIRAPSIVATRPDVEILSEFDGLPTSVRWRNITAFTWHPELSAS